jgi:hypothetical protein
MRLKNPVMIPKIFVIFRNSEIFKALKIKEVSPFKGIPEKYWILNRA